MSHTVTVSAEARAKDDAFLKERKASGKQKYIVRHSKQARVTHGVTVIACILLCISGLFVFVPQLAQAVGADTVFAIRMSHRVIGCIFVLVPLISAILAPKGVVHIFKNLFAEVEQRRQEVDDAVLPIPVHGEVDSHARPGRGEVRPALR